MTLPPDHLRYPHRRHGMDHDRYPWSHLFERPRVAWPGGARVALWVTPIVQWFPLDMGAKPFRAPGGLTMPYPDLRHYTQRDYGTRVGIFRILDLLGRRGVPASVAMDAACARRYPAVVRAVLAGGHEVVAGGVHAAALHHAGLSEEDEAAMVRGTVDALREATGQEVQGWLSPGRSQSGRTLDLLAAAGLRYCCDWANDDMPYAMRAGAGTLHAMPLAYETDDRVTMLEFNHTEDDWATQVRDRFDVLHREAAEYGGRIMSLPLHAWVSGTPARITYVAEVLDHILGHEGVWPATGAAILDAFRQG